MTFTAFFGETPRNRLLDFLGDHPTSDYTITEMAEKSGISRPTVYDELPDLEETGLVVQTRKVGQSRLFKLNTGHPVVREVLTSDARAVRDEDTPDGQPAASATS
jgi:DNA-binding transcriptional ArsR family regulator